MIIIKKRQKKAEKWANDVQKMDQRSTKDGPNIDKKLIKIDQKLGKRTKNGHKIDQKRPKSGPKAASKQTKNGQKMDLNLKLLNRLTNNLRQTSSKSKTAPKI